MRPFALVVLAQAVSFATAQDTSSSQEVVTLTGTNSGDVTSTGEDYRTTGVTYASNGQTITFTSTATGRATALSSIIANATASGSSNTTSSPTQTVLVGGTATSNSTNSRNATSTSSSALPTNTVPCNGYASFCDRQYSNITHIAAHNSPFSRPGNAASNQALDVVSQLNDGVRMLQFQTHFENDTLYLCHSSCDILNVGLLQDYLSTVHDWLDQNPTDVITILMGNSDVVPPERYIPPVENSGLIDMVYTPSSQPMSLDDWPTLGEMIITNQRVVIMLDYEANQETIPWLMDEFSYVWETPFSPTDRDFPCTVQRPPDQDEETSRNRMYMANHNLNVDIAFAGVSLLVPATTILNETNAVEGFGSVGAMVGNCTNDWDRPPNFLLVDYYNIGSFNGSVFQVAATANDVDYDRDSCCDTEQRNFNMADNLRPSSWVVLGLTMALCFGFR